MADFYTRMAATATRLLRDFGAPITLIRTTGESVDPVTGDVTTGIETALSVKGIVRPYPDELVDGDRILESDRMVILPSTYAPDIEDKLRIDGDDVYGEEWLIQKITTVKPADTALVYFVQVRR